MPPNPDAIADCVLATFAKLPRRFKPRTLANGKREWVPLAGIVLSKGAPMYLEESSDPTDSRNSSGR